jgi:hypothetical protein
LVNTYPYPYRPLYGTIKKSKVIYKVHKIRLGYIKMFDVYFFSTVQYTTHAVQKASNVLRMFYFWDLR